MQPKTFADLGVSAAVCDSLAEHGITQPFAVQELVLPDALAGHDVLAGAPTGSGKTLAFGLALIERIDPSDRRAAALVLAPTRELAEQIFEDMRAPAKARALSVAAVYGGVGIQAQARRASRAHILIATPGRLLDLIDRGDVSLAHLRVLVLDECDRMLDMGFRPDVDRIVDTTPAERQTLFFSATLEGLVGDVARSYTSEPRRHSHKPERSTSKVEHRFVRVEHSAKLDRLVAELSSEERELALVFVRTKRGADRLVKRLSREGHEAVAIHGNRSQAQRRRALAAFEEGRVATLVATDVAARGIDVRGISHVINFDPPDDGDTYVHRVGRTARAGASGIGVTFVGSEQAGDVAKFATELGLADELSAGGLESRSARRSKGHAQGNGDGRHQSGGGRGRRGSGRGRRRRSGRAPSGGAR